MDLDRQIQFEPDPRFGDEFWERSRVAVIASLILDQA